MWDLLRYSFFQNALLGSMFASVACAIIGTYIVSRRLVFISGGITHASFGGIGIGIYAGISPIFCAAVYSVLSALGIEWFSRKSNVREDSAIAVFWTFGMSIGIIFSFLTKSYVPDISSYLFGNILAVTHADLVFILCMALVLVVFFSLYARSIISLSFDRDFAMSNGIPVALFEYVLMALIALTVVSCLRMIGIVLAISLLTIPQMTANIFTKNFVRIIWLSMLIGFLGCVGGLFLSYYLNVPSGACIIFFFILIYAVCKLLHDKRYNLKYRKIWKLKFNR